MASLATIVITLNTAEFAIYQSERINGATMRDALAHLGYGNNLAGHGSAPDRGSADAYYGRPRRPHCRMRLHMAGVEITEAQMTTEEIAAYNEAYQSETERKQWE
jgi:hypothetical protein